MKTLTRRAHSLSLFTLIALAAGCAAPTDDAADGTATEADALRARGIVHVGNATQFTGQGDPRAGAIGACGVPEGMLGTENYVALNVQHTPGDYGQGLPRPIAGSLRGKLGAYANGKNCGRVMRVEVDARCSGVNDGAPGKPFCRGGAGFVADPHERAALSMTVSDSCQDGNAWCRDDPYHVDLHSPALRHFFRGGKAVNIGAGWTNDRVKWQFERAPRYEGDVRIAFAHDAFGYWPTIIVSHLENGIHAVLQEEDGGRFTRVEPNNDQGQVFVLNPAKTFRIKIVDADDREANGGRVYSFALPASCENRCQPPFTEVRYEARR